MQFSIWIRALALLMLWGNVHCSSIPAALDASVDAPLEAGNNPWCGNDASVAYPPGPYGVTNGSIVPELTFADGPSTTVSLRSLFSPCAERPKLLLIRVFAAWSGPSQWAAAHSNRFRSSAPEGRVFLLDLLAFGEDNLPARLEDLPAWRARYDAPPDALAIDPAYRFREVFLTAGHVPIVVLVDPRTMRVLATHVAPQQELLQSDVRRFAAQLEGRPEPPLARVEFYDGRFSQDWLDQLRAMSPIPAPPPSPSNRVADDPRAAALGRMLFFDAGLSPSGTVACSTCHAPERGFSDGRATGRGVAALNRNSPSVLFAAHGRWQFWDGRADTLWAQALGPFEDASEMNSSRLHVAHQIAQRYAQPYTALFGALPPLDDAQRFPPEGKPGTPPWERMTTEDRMLVDRVFSNVGKVLEAYERSLRTRPTRFDEYAAGNRDALTASQRDGLRQFFMFGCIQCHHGPLLTDQSFHNVLMPTGRLDLTPDRGRIDAITPLQQNPFSSMGAFSDATSARPGLSMLAVSDTMLGQFKTPSLRAVALTGPWGHGGTFATLRDVVRHYAERSTGLPVTGSAGMADRHVNGFYLNDVTFQHFVDLLSAFDDAPPP